MSECIRRPGSVWTNCACPDCRTDQARKAKRARNGVRVADQRAAAWARVCAWVEAGYSAGIIGQLAGVGPNSAHGIVRDARAGHPRPIRHETARRILAAPAQPTEGEGWVPSVGTVRRLQALTVMGWSMAALAARAGISESTLHALRDPRHRHTRPHFAAAVARLYDELSMRHGSGRGVAARAVRKGWAPPLAWDDDAIDDPAAVPNLGAKERGRITADEVAWFLEHQPAATAQHVANRFGVSRDAVQVCVHRAERLDLVERLNRNAEVAA